MAISKKQTSFKKLQYEIDVNQLLLHSRQLHLTGHVSEKVTQPLIDQIMTLQLISDEPIILWINSPGGYCTDGFALVDTIRMSKVPIYTIVRGQACSMAAVISVSGHYRYITENSWWMAHDVFGGGLDYAEKIKERINYTLELQKQVFEFWTQHTKLTKEELDKARFQELWLNPEQCLAKGIVDKVFKMERKTK